MKYLITLIQVADVTVHILANQVEPLRITANVIIIIWILLPSKNMTRSLSLGSISLFAILNIYFLSQFGVTNDGSPRIFFWGAVVSTLVLSGYFIKDIDFR